MTIQQLLTTPTYIGLLVTLTLILVDAAIGVVQAIETGTFQLGKLGQFAQTHVLPQLGGTIGGAVLQYFGNQAGVAGGITGIAASTFFWGIVAAVNLSLFRDILVKFGVQAAILGSKPGAGAGATSPPESASTGH